MTPINKNTALINITCLEAIHGDVTSMSGMIERMRDYGDMPYGTIHQVQTDINAVKRVFEVYLKARETCIHCGRSVKQGSGRFINRIPVMDPFEVREETFDYPLGEFICPECEADFYTEEEEQ